MKGQLPLNLRIKDASSFDNFVPARNAEVVARLRSAVTALTRDGQAERMVFLWGEPGTGKTHLLQAACRLAQEHGLTPIYLPLSEVLRLSTAMLEDAENRRLICIDDVQCVAGDVEWERALFGLCERLRETGGTLIVAATANPAHLELRMPEVKTRFNWGPVYRLHPLTDAGKLEAIRLRAGNRGLDVTDEVARYILNRHRRDLASLFELLERLDRRSLASQRRLTIPFIRKLE